MAKCTCGFTRFRESRSSSEADVACWVLYSSTVLGGFGASPIGTFLGAGDEPEEEDDLWAKILVPVTYTDLSTNCLSCGRLRFRKTLGGLGVATSYSHNGNLYLVTMSITNLGCYSIEFRGAETFSVPIRRIASTPPALHVDNVLAFSLDPPAADPRATTVLYVPIPADVNQPGIYTVHVVDTCAGTERALGTIYLENEPMIIPLQTAEYDMPERMLQQGAVASSATDPGIVSYGNPYTLPFDKCDAVVEYDPRLGTTPTTQGWTETNVGLGLYTVANGVLRHVQPAGSASTFAKNVVTAAPPTQIYSYFSFLTDAYVPPTAAKAIAVYGDGTNIRYLPFECTGESTGPTLFMPSKASPDLTLVAEGKYGWARAGIFRTNSLFIASIGDTSQGGGLDPGTVPYPGIHFGLTVGSDSLVGTGGSTYYRYACASSPGRFLRPYFRAVSSVNSPVLRLYVMSEAYAGENTARFKIRYDPSTVSPLGRPSQEVSVTGALSTAGTVYELAVTLADVGVGPVWFTVEREWDHADDALSSTAHLVQLTLRSV